LKLREFNYDWLDYLRGHHWDSIPEATYRDIVNKFRMKIFVLIIVQFLKMNW